MRVSHVEMKFILLFDFHDSVTKCEHSYHVASIQVLRVQFKSLKRSFEIVNRGRIIHMNKYFAR